MDSLVFRNLIRSRSGLIINKMLISAVGPEMAVFISDLADRDEYFYKSNPKYEGWFYSKKETRSEELGLSDRALRRLMAQAQESNFLELRMKGNPAKQEIKLNYTAIYQLIENFSLLKTVPASIDETVPTSRYRTVPASIDETVPAIYNHTKNLTKELKPLPLSGKKPKPSLELPTINPINTIIHFSDKLPTPYQNNSEFMKLWSDYGNMRKGKNAKITERAVELIVSDLRKLCRGDIDYAIHCIKKSVMNSWTGLFFDKDRNKDYKLNQPVKQKQTPQPVKESKGTTNPYINYNEDLIPDESYDELLVDIKRRKR